jgi:glycosyltransferase involved in cell wall biosynthesis
MHILYVHQNFPAQFGHIARHLVQKLGWQCTFVSETPAGEVEGIRKIQYRTTGGATKQTHYCSRTFENTVWHCDGVFNALKAHPDIQPDLIVGHSGFGSTLFLRELYGDVPIVNFFEYYYRPHDPLDDMDFRRDLAWPVPEINYTRALCRNAMILLDLQNCDMGYVPTQFQRSRFPQEYDGKLQVIFDGVDRSIYHGHNEELRPPVAQRGMRNIAGVEVPADTRIVTYVSRGFESMRGFDIFMRSAKLIYQQYPNVLFFVVGADRIAYGGDMNYIKGKSFKDWVMAQDKYDPSKFVFTGRIPSAVLSRLLAASDLHIYLTVPFVLSWSMMDAMSCGAVVLGSNTAPVQEMIRPGKNGLLADFFNPEDFARQAVEVLKDPAQFRPLGRSAEEMITSQYSLDAVLPRMLQLYEQTVSAKPRAPRPPRRPTATSAVVPSASTKNQSPFLR